MTRYGVGGAKIVTKPTTVVAGGMADPNRVRYEHLIGPPRPAWADDPNQILPCQEPEAAPSPEHDIFHPVVSGEAAKWAEMRAGEFCDRCPFGPAGQGSRRDACLEHGLVNNEWGIWGGRKLDGLGQPGRRALLAEVRKRRGAA
jgi:hypothetical protein